MPVLLDLLGWVALLVWGMRMVRTGIMRAYGADLRAMLARGTRNRFTAYLGGMLATCVLQSSTATGLITLSFASRGLIALPMALAVMLGADLGTSLVAQALAWRTGHLAPVLILVGVVAFLAAPRTRWKDLGRALTGLGLMLLALQMIGLASLPLRESDVLPLILDAASDDLLLLLFAALLTWLAHSSLAIVLLLIAFAGAGVLDLHQGLVMVLGANVGGLVAPILASLAEPIEARRVVYGNAFFRVIGAALFLPVLDAIAPLLAHWSDDPARQLVNFHTIFNVVLGLIFLGFVEQAGRAMTTLFPSAPRPSDEGAPRYLDRSTLATPSLALTCAEREALHMGDVVTEMLEGAMEALTRDDRKRVAAIEALDDRIDRLHREIKLFLTDLTRESLDEAMGARATEILAFTTNLEHVGDIIDKSLMDLARKRLKHKIAFSAEGLAELRSLHERVCGNHRLALGVFMSRDLAIARMLVADKVGVRNEEWASAQSHLARLRAGRPESIESSALHLDVLSDLKRIHSHICSVAYPVLDRAGHIRPTRLVTVDEETAATGLADPAALPGRTEA
ncbi:Na/Pi cotransporter family protein [Faunimonas sp. B44]|uniref:Na/Pi cotransporter family protein n=1 Tax=Faunimonas sp. B44 TaxID=3461493 RepID=UPI004043DB66